MAVITELVQEQEGPQAQGGDDMERCQAQGQPPSQRPAMSGAELFSPCSKAARAAQPPGLAKVEGSPGSIVYCGFTKGSEPIEMLSQHGPPEYFRGHVHFTRWLFQQPRGNITPSTSLLVAWRDAKACLLAIKAAQTDVKVGLRYDAKCPNLCDIEGDIPKGGWAKVAINCVIIFVESKDALHQAARRAKKWRASFDDISIDILQASTAGPEKAPRLKKALLNRKPFPGATPRWCNGQLQHVISL